MPLLTKDCIEKINMSMPLGGMLPRSEKYPKEYGCPYCKSPHHVTIFPENNVAHCAKCGKDFNAIQALQEIGGEDFLTVAKRLAEQAGIPLEYEQGPAGSQKPAEAPERPLEAPERKNPENTPGKYKELIEGAIKGVDGAREYLHGRGIEDNTIKTYKIGCREEYFPAAGKKMLAVIFPYSMDFSYYGARSIDGKYFKKPKAEEAGEEPVYNRAALYQKKPCFVCESILDALSIIQAGGNAIALGGVAYENNLLLDLKKKKPAAPLILCLDNDTVNEQGHRPGPEAQAKLEKELSALHIRYINAFFDYSLYNGPRKDANDLIRANKAQFVQDIKANEAAALDDTGIEKFLFETNTRRFEPIPTGLKKIDNILQGGFIPQSLVLLGSPPGLGKTIIASEIFESMAKAARPGIYINLEMSQEQLIARSLSRRIYQKNNNYRLTSLDILQGYKLTDTQKQLIQEAAREYKAEVDGRLQYNPGGVGTNIDNIIEYLEGAAEEAEREGKHAANVCIDYLHLLTGEPGEDTAGVIKRAVFALKDYAVKHNAVVLAIMAQSRDANRRQEAVLEAGRDTSGLEYSGDVIMQLVHEKDTPEDEINLCITKSRFTSVNMKGYTFTRYGDVSYMEPEE